MRRDALLALHAGTIDASTHRALPNFPYNRAANAGEFPAAWNLANQLRLRRDAWHLVLTREQVLGVSYRTVTRFSPDSVLAAGARIDRDAWAEEGR